MPATWIAAAGLAVGVLSGASAKKASKKARNDQIEIARIRNKQARRAALNEFRQAQANAILGGVASGGGLDSTRTRGELVSNTTQQFRRLEEMDRQTRLGDAIIVNQNLQADANFNAQLARSFTSFVTSPGVYDALSNFGSGGTTTTTPVTTPAPSSAPATGPTTIGMPTTGKT